MGTPAKRLFIIFGLLDMLAGSGWGRTFFIDAQGGNNSYTGRTEVQAVPA
jgi:hypothetical protein